VVTALKARNISGNEKVLLAIQISPMATLYLAPSALSILTALSWGDAPGFCISRPWRLVEPTIQTTTLLAIAVNPVKFQTVRKVET